MGYAHSLVIARQDTEQEQEKLKKLPEYNPRTLWSSVDTSTVLLGQKPVVLSTNVLVTLICEWGRWVKEEWGWGSGEGWSHKSERFLLHSLTTSKPTLKSEIMVQIMGTPAVTLISPLILQHFTHSRVVLPTPPPLFPFYNTANNWRLHVCCFFSRGNVWDDSVV